MERFANNTTPLLRNHWYVAALANELTGQPIERRVLDRSLLLVRDSGNQPVVLSNRCPHRSFPLGRSSVDGDIITCGYHGIQFRTDGSCVKVPSQSSVPSALRVRSYPTVEVGPLVWVWMGDPGLATLTPVPETPWLVSDEFATVADYFFVESSYVRMHENVMDLTHLPFLHGTVFQSMEFAEAKPEVEAIGTKVRSSMDSPVGSMPPHMNKILGMGGARALRHTEAWFDTPALHYALATYRLVDAGPEDRTDYRWTYLHAFTPETLTTTHYFWAVSRDSALADEAISAEVRRNQRYVFNQDVDGMRWVEEECAREVDPVKELSVAADRPGLLLRRHIAMMAAAEAGTDAVPAGAR